jgi:hypothetical protein
MRVIGLLVALLLVSSLEASANFYKYRDSSGAIVITDKLENVPPKYRKQYKVVWDKDLEAQYPLAKRKAAARAVHEKREQEQQQRKAAEKQKPSDGKRLVITVDEETGQLIRTME